MRRLKLLGVLIGATGLLAAACGTSSSSGSGPANSSAPSGTLTIDNESWLATSYAWSNGNKTLTFTIRKGVKFGNGDPLTPADVLYTFNLLKQNKVLDINSVWSVLSNVALSGSDQVVMTFKAPAVTYFYYIADQIGIVDQKVWSKAGNPATNLDKNPIGTGPYTTGSSTCSAQNIKYVANAHYWQPGLPKVGTINYPAFLTNDTADTYLENGSAQWGSQYIPGIQTAYLSKSPNYHYWFPPTSSVSVFINLTDPILKNVAVRQAMAYAINRQKASVIGEGGEEAPSNQAGIVSPTFSSWLNTSQAAAYGNNYAYNPAKAISILTAAGFKRGSNGIFMTKSGQPLSFTIINNAGFSDWVAAVSTIQQSLKAVGIKVTPQNVASTAYQSDLYTGKYQLGYGSETGGPSPFFELRQWLYSGNSAKIGVAAGSNFDRYTNAATDALINQYPTTTSTATQHSIVDQLQKVMLQDVPVIPVTQSVDWFQYDTGSFSGWPTPGNPYAQPAAYNYPDWAQVMLHLVPKK